jgi:hypothetical protein
MPVAAGNDGVVHGDAERRARATATIRITAAQ